MKLLVTGGVGFIGSHFIRAWLNAHPADDVINLDLLTYAGSRARLADLEQRPTYRFVHGDICDRRVVRQAMQGCHGVVHFAAETHVDRSITNASPFLRTNVEGTQTLLEAARELGVKRFLFISTDEVYGPVLTGTVDEAAPLKPRSPYAASKAAADLLVQAFRDTYGVPTLIARPTNIFGPGQLPEKFMPLCITHGMQGLPLPIYGDGQQRRSWLFVEDACRALAVILEQGELGAIYNIASGSERVNVDVATSILSRLGQPLTLLQFVEDRPGHDRRYAMTDEKLRALGWRAQMEFEEGLSETIDWYRHQAQWWRPLMQQLHEDSYHWLNRPARSSSGHAVRASA